MAYKREISLFVLGSVQSISGNFYFGLPFIAMLVQRIGTAHQKSYDTEYLHIK